MTTSFDTPRVLGHHNPFASFQDTTDDPLASGGGSFAQGAHTGGNSGSTSTDPWSSYYNPPIISTSSTASSSKNALLSSGVLDEDDVPDIYVQAWNAAATSSSSSSFGSAFNTGNTVSLAVVQKVLSTCAGLGAGETEKIINLVSTSSGNLASSYTVTGGNATSPTSPFRTAGSGGGNGRITKLEFYIAIALAALAQQKEPLSIQAVTSRRHNLPIPNLDLSLLQAGGGGCTLTRRPSNARNPSSPSVPYRSHKMSIGSSSDPWSAGGNTTTANPSASTNHHHHAGPSNGKNGNIDPFMTSPSKYSGVSQPPMYSPPRTARTTDNGYSSFPTYNEADDEHNHHQQHHLGHSYNDDEGDDDISAPQSEYMNRTTGESSNSALLSLRPFYTCIKFSNEMERIKLIQLPELKGNFLTRYTVYKVIITCSSSRKRNQQGNNSMVEVNRRYSDWSWLNDYLELKYPGRVKLSLPPKRMGISARHVHIPSDEQFLERRRRGLSRYLEFLANHPIMKHDKAIKAFLTETTMDYSTWRKMNTSSLTIDSTTTDEASLIGKISTSQESLIPISFESILSTLKESLPSLIEALTRFCALLERINYRNEQNNADLIRVRMAFDSFGEIYKGLNSGSSSSTSSSTTTSNTTGGINNANHAGRPKEIEEETMILNRDIGMFSENMGRIAELQEGNISGSGKTEEVGERGGAEGGGRIEMLERDLKFQRDIWRSLLQLLNKYETRLKHDNIDKIKKKIEISQSRYSTINNTPVANRKNNSEEEMKKLINSIQDDQNEIQRLLNRRVFFKWSIVGEIRWIWRCSTLIRVNMSDWIKRENKHYEEISRIWGQLEDALSL